MTVDGFGQGVIAKKFNEGNPIVLTRGQTTIKCTVEDAVAVAKTENTTPKLQKALHITDPMNLDSAILHTLATPPEGKHDCSMCVFLSFFFCSPTHMYLLYKVSNL